MIELVGNLHLHTTASDGTGSHDEVAAAAARAGLDFIIYTDHNVTVQGVEGWYRDLQTGRDLLRLMGQEVNDEAEVPEHSHLLCYFVDDELQTVAPDPQRLIDAVTGRGGLCFLAHPLEQPGYNGQRGDTGYYPWRHWEVSGYTGIELWNAMSDVKRQLRTVPRGLLGAYLPAWSITAPFPETLARWDALLASGRKVVAIGNSDAHAMRFTLYKILRRTVHPYEYLFRAVNTHLLVDRPLDRDTGRAQDQLHYALASGHCFVGYDLIGSTCGFNFTAASADRQAMMGDTLVLQDQATLRVTSPLPAKLRLLKDGRPLVETQTAELTWQTAEPGIYRVEAYRRYWGWQRGWVFTNPIYVVAGR
jgi:hypothetical protein